MTKNSFVAEVTFNSAELLVLEKRMHFVLTLQN